MIQDFFKNKDTLNKHVLVLEIGLRFHVVQEFPPDLQQNNLALAVYCSLFICNLNQYFKTYHTSLILKINFDIQLFFYYSFRFLPIFINQYLLIN